MLNKIVECFRFSVCIKYASGKFSKRQRISLSTNHPVHFDEGKLVDKEIFCFLLNFPGKFSRQSEIFPVACVMRKIRELNSL